jgi:hypothetical protein
MKQYYKTIFRIPFIAFCVRAFLYVDKNTLFAYDNGLDIWSIVHILAWVGIGWGIKHVSVAQLQELQNTIYMRVIGEVQKQIPTQVQKFIDMNELQQVPILHFDVGFVLGCAYFWEAVEHYLEYMPWFQVYVPGYEHWFNRLVLDPLMLVIGYGIAHFFPRLVGPAMLVCGGLVMYLTW